MALLVVRIPRTILLQVLTVYSNATKTIENMSGASVPS